MRAVTNVKLWGSCPAKTKYLGHSLVSLRNSVVFNVPWFRVPKSDRLIGINKIERLMRIK